MDGHPGPNSSTSRPGPPEFNLVRPGHAPPPQGDFTIPRQPRETQSPRRHQAGFRPDFGWMPGLGAEGNDQCMTSPPYPSETDVTASLPHSKGADRANGAVRP